MATSRPANAIRKGWPVNTPVAAPIAVAPTTNSTAGQINSDVFNTTMARAKHPPATPAKAIIPNRLRRCNSGWGIADGLIRCSRAIDPAPTPFCFQQRHNSFNALSTDCVCAISREEWACKTPQFSAKRAVRSLAKSCRLLSEHFGGSLGAAVTDEIFVRPFDQWTNHRVTFDAEGAVRLAFWAFSPPPSEWPNHDWLRPSFADSEGTGHSGHSTNRRLRRAGHLGGPDFVLKWESCPSPGRHGQLR